MADPVEVDCNANWQNFYQKQRRRTKQIFSFVYPWKTVRLHGKKLQNATKCNNALNYQNKNKKTKMEIGKFYTVPQKLCASI